MHAESNHLSVSLLRAYRRWVDKWPELGQWYKKAALSPEWWDRASGVCQETDTPPELMIYITWAYANARPEDFYVSFSPTIFRSTGILYRSISNYRDMMANVIRSIEPLHMIENDGNGFVAPKGTLEFTRKVLEYGVKYFKYVNEVKSYPVRKAVGPLSDIMQDTLCYSACNQNPFLLLTMAQTPTIRALARSNVVTLCNEQPWHFEIWEGIAGDRLQDLQDCHEIVVKNFDNDIRYHWPVDPWALPYFVADRTQLRPTLHMLEGCLCHKTDLYLRGVLDLNRRKRV